MFHLENIEENLKAVVDLKSQLPLNLVQIDDGFQSEGGDWFEFSSNFPDGLASIAGRIKGANLVPKLWLAPFIANRGAKLIREHPEYILRKGAGRMVNAGFISNKFAVSLDISHPGALEYASSVIHKAVHEWGFPYLKLEFLYAAALPGNHYDPTRTRAQILRAGLETLRAAAGKDTYLLGCGVPLGSALGLFESMRISADVNFAWKSKLFGISTFIKNDRQLPSAFNALHNTIARSAFHKRWWINDPDCLWVRPETDLTLSEVQTAATVIELSGGSILLSDNLPALTPERLRIAKALLPIVGKRPDIMDWFDKETPQYMKLDLAGAVSEWCLLAWVNWEDEPRGVTLWNSDFRLEDGDYWVRSFWDKELRLSRKNQPIWKQSVPSHGVVFLAARKEYPGDVQYLGSDLHISQGLEVNEWEVSECEIKCVLDLERQYQGTVELFIPYHITGACFAGAPLSWRMVEEDVYGFFFQIDRPSALIIRYDQTL